MNQTASLPEVSVSFQSHEYLANHDFRACPWSNRILIHKGRLTTTFAAKHKDCLQLVQVPSALLVGDIELQPGGIDRFTECSQPHETGVSVDIVNSEVVGNDNAAWSRAFENMFILSDGRMAIVADRTALVIAM